MPLVSILRFKKFRQLPLPVSWILILGSQLPCSEKAQLVFWREFCRKELRVMTVPAEHPVDSQHQFSSHTIEPILEKPSSISNQVGAKEPVIRSSYQHLHKCRLIKKWFCGFNSRSFECFLYTRTVPFYEHLHTSQACYFYNSVLYLLALREYILHKATLHVVPQNNDNLLLDQVS